MDEFNNCIEDCGLSDIKTTGLFFTWQNNNTAYFIQRKLDRVLVNDMWLCKYPLSSATCVPHNISDHTPLVVDLANSQPSKGRTFKFFNHWTEYPEFLPLVERIWATPMFGSPMFKVANKLKLLKGELRTLQAVKKEQQVKRSKELETLLLNLQTKIDTEGLREEHTFAELNALKVEALVLANLEEAEAKQKSRINWLKLGDKNTAFFHKKINQRTNQNNITKLIDEERIEHIGEHQVGQLVATYYTNLFNDRDNATLNSEVLNEVCGDRLSTSQIQSLTAPVTREDIREVFMGLNSHKALGPDGFNGHFFKPTWEIVGGDMEEAILDFFRNNGFLKQINHTAISLIPKVPNPSSLGEFRPIACCNVLYKTVSKILAKRLREVLPSIIHESQNGFLRGRFLKWHSN